MTKNTNTSDTERPGYKHTKLGWIPVEWEVVRLKEIAESGRGKFSNGPFGSDLLSSELQPEGVPVIYIRDIKPLSFNWISNVFVTEAKADYLIASEVKRGDVIITKVGDPPGDAAYYDKSWRSIMTQDVIRIRPSKKISGLLLSYLLNSEQTTKQIHQTKIDGTRSRVSLTEYKKIKIPLPPLPEQTRIANLLSTWDQAITTTRQLINALETRKRGLMQQLLTGEVRLPGFSGEWESTRIGKVAKEYSKKNKADDDLIVFSCTKYDGLVPSLEYFGRRVYGSDTSKYKIVQPGYFAYATNHIEEGSIGILHADNPGLISPMYTVFKTNDLVDDSYLYAVLKSDKMIYAYQSNTSGSVARRGGLRWDVFKSLEIIIPDEKEQTAIASVLATAEKEISLYRQKLTSLKTQKRGLMQQLLTGQKRLPA